MKVYVWNKGIFKLVIKTWILKIYFLNILSKNYFFDRNNKLGENSFHYFKLAKEILINGLLS